MHVNCSAYLTVSILFYSRSASYVCSSTAQSLNLFISRFLVLCFLVGVFCLLVWLVWGVFFVFFFFFKAFAGGDLYELLKDYILTKGQLNENNFPRPNPKKSGSAILAKVVEGPAQDGKCLLDCSKIEFQSLVPSIVKHMSMK